MTRILIQAVLSLLAGWGIYALWRRVSGASRAVYLLVTAGVLLRAFAGQVAFWISYLHLPIAKSLQLGGGLWFFGLDGLTYFYDASAAAYRGPAAILFISRSASSVFFQQTLATFVYLFGSVPSTALLLNLAAYLGSCLIVLSFGDPNQRRVIVFAIAILSLTPSAVLWSLQPMKDITFLFLVALFFWAAHLWQQRWADAKQQQGKGIGAGLLAAAGMAVALYGISGIRWYIGFVIVLALLPFALLTIVNAQRRLHAAIGTFVLVPFLVAAFLWGGGPVIPWNVREAIVGGSARQVIGLPGTIYSMINKYREGYDNLGGATLIRLGHKAQKPKPVAGNPASQAAPQQQVPMTSQVPPNPSLPQPAVAAAGARPPASPPASAPRHVARTKPREEGSTPGEDLNVPSSPAARVFAGTAAMILPRAVAQRLGLIELGGGRGLWLVVEVDTLAFDVALLFALAFIVRTVSRRGMQPPVFWMLLIVTGGIALALAYTVSNFGTLFRHRDMVLLGLALLPAAALPARDKEPPRMAPAEVVLPA